MKEMSIQGEINVGVDRPDVWRIVGIVTSLIGGMFVLSSVLTVYMAFATLAYFCMVSGIASRRNKTRHAVFMASAVFLDLAIVLILELSRDAVGTAASGTLGVPQTLHIVFSSLAVALYFPLVVAGFRRYRGQSGYSKWHKRTGIIAFIFRSLGFLFMFSLLWK